MSDTPIRLSIEYGGQHINEDGKYVVIFIVCGEKMEFEIEGFTDEGKWKIKTDGNETV